MKYAVISDVHSNFIALEKVLEQVDAEGIDTILCSGDLVGYNSQPNQVVEELKRRGVRCIRGNHDDALVTPTGTWNMNSLASEAIMWTRSHLSADNVSFIGSLPGTLVVDGTALFHGSPFDPYEYIYEDMVDEKLALASGRPVTVLGHTHVPYIRHVAGVMVVNPGSVGQPRDGDARASFAIIDGDSAEIRRVPYDIEGIVESNMAAGLPTPLSERLRWGV